MRIRLFANILALLLSGSVYAQIANNTNFEFLGEIPADTRDTLTTLGDTSNVVWKYPGLLSYALDVDSYWYYNGSYWKEFAQGGANNFFISGDTLYAVSLDSTFTIDLSLYLDNDTIYQFIDSLELQGDTMLRISLSDDGVPMKELDLSALNVTPTLAEVSSFSDDATKSTYTMSAGVPVEFESSGNNTILYIDETNERVGIGTNSPTEKLSVSSRIRVNNGILDMKNTDVYLGLDAGNSQLTHFNNFFAGYRAGSMANSFANTMVGGDAGRLNTGNRNTFLGAFAGENATSSESVVIGSTAGRNSAPGSSVVIGSEAGIDATGDKNVIIGHRSGSVNAASNNVFLGASAGAANTSGFNNLFLGYEAGKKVTTGNNNTIIGTGNVSNLTTGSTNTIIGSSNARDLTSGQYNTIIGTLSGTKFQGASNLLLGYQALFNDTLSNNSIVIGNGAAYHSYNTSSSVFLGNAAGPSTAKSISSKLYISNTAGAPTIYGEFATKNIGIGQETADYVLDMGLRTGAVRFPLGTTAQRPIGADGLLRYNSDLTAFEGYYNAQWNRLVDHDYLNDNYWTKSGSDLYYSGGNVGIGTNNPSAQLEIASSNPTMRFYDTDTGKPAQLNSDNSGNLYVNFNTGTTGDFRIYSGGSTIHSIFNETGNFGIGTTSPAADIEIKSTVPTIRLTSSTTNNYGEIAGDGTGNIYFNYQTGSVSQIRFYDGGNSLLTLFDNNGNVGIGDATPTAKLHIAAGTATANTAPLKFTSGTNLTTPEAGAMEWDGTNLYITQATGPTRKTIAYTDDITAEVNDLTSAVTWANVPDVNITQSSVLQHQGALTIDNIPSRRIPIGTGTGIISATGFQLTTEGTLEWYSSTGADNTGAGGGALRFLNGTSTSNSAFGIQSMGTGIKNNADLNSSFGAYSLAYITEGDYNTSLGAYSGLTLTTGSNNLFGGIYAGDNITTGSGNILLGTQAGANDATYNPDNMIAIGNRAAYNVDASNSESIFIGAESGSNEATYSDLILIGSQASATQSNQIVIGHEKTGFESTQLKSRNYRWNIDQTLGASQDGYVMTYNNTSGELELQAGDVSDGNGIFDAANDDGTIPATFEARLTDILYFSDSSGNEFMTLNGTTQQVGIGTIPSYDLDVDGTFGVSGTVRFEGYGVGLKEAADLSKTRSGYIATYATDGTLLEEEFTNPYGGESSLAGILDSLYANQIPNNSNIYYVSIGGNNSYARSGDILTNYADPWSAIDSAYILTTDPIRISIAPGTYTFSGTYLADNTTSLLQPTNSTPVSIYGPDATISYNSSPYTTGFISDMNAGWTTSPSPIDLTLNVKELSMLSTSASVACPILVTNPDSRVSGKIGVIRSATSFGTNNRNWGIEVGANYVDLEVDTIWYDGDLAVSFWRSYDASGIVDNMKERNMKVAVDYIYVASQRSAIGGVFRVQPGLPGSGPHTDSLSTYEYNIGTVDVSSTTTHESLIDFGAQSSVDIIYGNTYTGSVKKVNNASFDQVFGIAMGASDTSRASTYNYNVEVITGLDGRLFGPSATSGVFDNIDLNININKSDFQDGGEIEFGTISVFNSRININCNDCKSSNADALIKFNFTSSGGNKIIVSGNWWNNSSAPVIDVSGLATTDTLILQNVQLRNDGSVAAVNSTTSKTVYVKGVFDWNTIIQDVDITFIRLDEYGLSLNGASFLAEDVSSSTISPATLKVITGETIGSDYAINARTSGDSLILKFFPAGLLPMSGSIADAAADQLMIIDVSESPDKAKRLTIQNMLGGSTAKTTPANAATVDFDANGLMGGKIQVNMTNVTTGITLSFSNMVDGGDYLIYFTNVTGTDTLTLPSGCINLQGDGSTVSSIDITENTYYYITYDGTNYYFR